MGALKAFLKTSIGQLTVIALIFGLILIAILAGPKIVGFFSPSSQVLDVKRSTILVGTQKEAATEPGAASISEVDRYNIYEAHDPFYPLIKPAAEGETSADQGGTLNPKALVVEKIFLENGVYYANINYGGTVYKVKDGERVGSSPYEVVQITSNNKVMLLYGDEATPAAVGEEIVK